ncbi:hypothetical protein [Enterovirga aerilata]|uniref:PAS domain-containing protein n=1 Tax=Enterovirga aerilata TaxID=2730920 RepID=A0A849I2C5_9HYPH|nr:hypothetical protein [Enterovirga sp. DB1703]NNM73966.1 hypothetical protein [Enterovirga sp. DB1703]
MADKEWLEPYRMDDEVTLFASLRALAESLTTEGRITGRNFTPEDFEAIADNLAIVQPARRFGDFRFAFYGSAFSDSSPAGDLNGVAFGDLLDSAYYRSCLAGFAHVHRLGLPHVTRDHPIVGGRSKYFTRLLIPVFAGNEPSLILCVAALHDEPTLRAAPPDHIELHLAASA